MSDSIGTWLDWRWLGSRSWLAAQAGSLVFVLVCCGIGVKLFVDLRAGRHGLGTPDYAGFYAAATILNEHEASRLYDLELQDRILRTKVPGTLCEEHYPFAHAPLVAFVLRPLARLPFAWSYLIWWVILAVIGGAGLALCRSLLSWPPGGIRGALLLAAAFPPLVLEGWLAGQWAMIGLFWVALSLRLVRDGRCFAGGLTLAMCAVKPTLLMFVLPLLVLSGKPRLIAGVGVGGLALVAVCLLIVGLDGARGYWDLLTTYSRTMSAGAENFKVFKHVDLHSFLVLLCGGPGWLPKCGVVAAATCFVPWLLAAWWSRAGRDGDREVLALCATLTGNLVFSAYTPIYDVALVVPNVLVTGEVIYRRCQGQAAGRAKLAFLLLAGLLVFSAWVTQASARVAGFQPLTLVLMSWSCFQVAFAVRGPFRAATPAEARPTRIHSRAELPRVPSALAGHPDPFGTFRAGPLSSAPRPDQTCGVSCTGRRG